MIYAVMGPLIATFFIPFLDKWKHRIHTGWFLLPIPFIIFIYFLQFISTELTPVRETYPWIPSLNIHFDLYLDGLSLLFALLISGIGTLVLLYSIYYLDRSEKLGHFYIYLMLFMSAMLGVVLSDNVFVLYTFWEFTSLSSFLLIGYWHHRERSRYGALKSMLITVFGGLSLLGGIILLSMTAETASIRAMIEHKEMIINSPYFPLILVFLFLGAFTKSAQFPFHIWLPDAMEAPTPVSAYLHSATMVKAGIYLIARFSPILAGEPAFFMVVSGIGIITLCWGSFMAVRQTDLKGILAFSTISQLGMIMTMLGFGTKAAVFAAVFHILNHATFKGSLFMVAGIVDHETGTRDIRKLGGLMALMPVSTTLAIFGTFSMAGVPLPFLNGFYSKEMFFDSSLDIGGFGLPFLDALAAAIPYLAVLGSIFTFVYSMYFFFGTFRGRLNINELPKKPHEAPWGMLASPVLLIGGVILIGLFPNVVNEPLLAQTAKAIYGDAIHKHIAFWHGLNTPFYMSMAVVGAGALLAFTRHKWSRVYDLFPEKWSLNRVYDQTVEGIYQFSESVTRGYMNGSLRRYVRLILLAMIAVSFTFLWVTDGFSISNADVSPISLTEVMVAVTMAAAAFGTIYTSNRIAAILILGVVGYGLSILFVIYRAPDLALTQLIVETVTVALFLLAFYHLPELRKIDDHKQERGINVIIAGLFGLLMTAVGISAHSSKWFEPISSYFVETSYTLGGGKNIVNVILVDMRGLDTLFEITVLGIAALAIYGLIKNRRTRE
ncbi:MAG: Na+/H+ antiporter subunit A [Bacillaceae bacterium]|nr:Na+/H+ antiporter subunit A [Bacillaceae bacterium]